MKRAPYQSGVVCLFLQLLPNHPLQGLVSGHTWEAPDQV